MYGIAAWRHRWLHEDGLINLRIVDQVLLGNGPVYNPGERVEAFTSPAQIIVLTLGRLLTLGLVRIELIVFVCGVTAAVVGVGCAVVGAARLWRPPASNRSGLLPVGAIVFIAIPSTWDFATSGHEGGLAFLWLGGCLLVLGTRIDRLRSGAETVVDRPRTALLLLGSGMLVRPELMLFSIAFTVCWLVVHRGLAGSRIRAVVLAATLPFVAQVLRMGYFGSLVPNTALAKLGAHDVGRGFSYLLDFVRPFGLLIVLPLVVIVTWPVLKAASREQRWVVGSFVVPAVLMVGQLVESGGDYINGRLLVAPLFAVLAPVFVVPAGRIWFGSRWAVARRVLLVGIACWAVAAALFLRLPWKIDSGDFLDPRFDARELAKQRWTEGGQLRSIDGYRGSFLANPANDWANTEDRSGPIMFVSDYFTPQAVPLPPGDAPAIASTAIGALGLSVGPDVRIIDRAALADPIGSRQPITSPTPGHMRTLPLPWAYARVDVDADPSSAAAIRAMECGALGDLMDSVTKPMTPARFVENLFHAPSNTLVKVPVKPEDAVDEYC